MMTETMSFHAVHPGTILKEELEARGLSAASFALRLRVPPQRIQEIVAGRRAITPETALRIGTALGTGARLWLAMQQAHDLRKAEIEVGAKVKAEVQPAA
jgi:addiction module HigA family antidote